MCKMKKSYFFGLALLFGATTGYAQKNIASFEDLEKAQTELKSLVANTDTLADLNDELTNAKNQYNNAAKTEKQTTTSFVMPYGEVEQADLVEFNAAFNNAIGNKDVNKTIKYFISAEGESMDANVVLHILPSSITVKDGDNFTVESFENSSYGSLYSSFKEVNASTFKGKNCDGSDFTGGESVTEIRLYYMRVEKVGADVTKPNYTWRVKSSTSISDEGYKSNKQIYNALKNFASSMMPGVDSWTTVVTTIGDQALMDFWTSEQDKIKEKITQKEGEIKTAEEYKSLVLTDNIDINESFSFGAWASDCTFDGGSKIITYTGNGIGSNLFTSNAGTIKNLGVVGGSVASANSGTIQLSYGNGTTAGTYNIYDNGGAVAYNVTLSPEVGYRYRTAFGYDIDNEKLTFDINNYKVYRGKYKIAGGDETSFYTNIGTEGLTGFTTGEDIFYYMEDTDAKTVLSNKNIANVVYKDGNDYICDSVKMSDKPTNGIYVPTSFTAKKLNYDRTINGNAELVTVCLPFNVPNDYINDKIGRSNTYSTSLTEGQLLQFNNVDAETTTFWFRYISTSMEANQPYVIKFAEDKKNASLDFNGMTNVRFVATPSNYMALAPVRQGTGGEFYGTFIKQTANELGDAENTGIYGYSGGQFVRATANATFQPGRAYVKSNIVPKNAAKAFSLKFMDEDGNDVTAISSVENAADEFTVNGGNGAISINADKAQNVKVYTVGGALVKSVDVEAGATSLPVSAGMYIVNGNKVVVK